MFDLTISQKHNLFNNFAQHWQEIIGAELLLISPEGEMLSASNGIIATDWREIVTQASPDKTTLLTDKKQSILIAPLAHDSQTLGYLLAIDAQEKDSSLLSWGAEMIVSAMVDRIALQNMTDELIGAWDQLELIYRVTKNIALTSDLMVALKSILKEIQKVVGTQDGFVVLKRSSEALDYVSCTTQNNAPYSETLLSNIIEDNDITLCNNPIACRHIWPEAPYNVKNMLAVSMPIPEEDGKAALGLINKKDTEFTAGDIKLLTALAQQVGTIIKNFLIHQKLLVEERLIHELEIAAEIQRNLLPNKLPQIGGLAIAVSSTPALEVGGDFYDFITVDDRNITLVIGDVAGKGIPAAMLTSMTRTMLRVAAMRGELPHTIIHQTNNLLHKELSEADSFVTVFVATLDTVKGTLKYASAGHTPSLLWRADTNTIEYLKATALPIGIFGYHSDSTRLTQLNPGDVLVLYTDGITEAKSPNNKLFGIERLVHIVESRANRSPEVIQQQIQSEIAHFCRNATGQDDAMLLIVKMLPKSESASLKNISTVMKTLDFSYKADIKHLADISKKVTDACRQLPALPPGSSTDDFICLIELAISEIFTNIVKYAYAEIDGRIDGRITLLSNGVQLDFYDTGHGFEPGNVPEPKSDPHDLTKEGGWGLHIVRQIMDVVSYEHDPKYGNHWHLLKLLPPS